MVQRPCLELSGSPPARRCSQRKRKPRGRSAYIVGVGFELSLATIAIEIALESRPLTQGQSKAILALWMPVHLAGNSFAARCLARAWEGCLQACAPPQIW